ncbi:hydroxyacid dehydrogenase [Streptomyces sp. NPDC058576]|uniref:hydroxyacid dehydrogenase n=1 Tax=Streptomyces sp. NPDC058576 TaxID=3346547 RepID=UPI00364DFD03
MHTHRPQAAIAMEPAFADQILTPAVRERLARSVRLPDGAVHADPLAGAGREVLGDAEILVTGWGCPPVDSAVLDAAPRLRSVVHTAGTVRGLITPECWSRGISVASAAAANALPVAEYTLAMILLTNKHILEGARELRLRRGQFEDPVYRRVPGNYRRTVGILSASLIGRRVIELLAPHDLDVLLYDPYTTPRQAEALGARSVPLPELFAAGDVISVHTPLLPETVGLVGEAELRAMRDGATLINTARGRVVDHDALARHLATGRIRAVLDVTDPEPLPADSPLYALDNVLVTPHIAGSAGGELARLGDFAAQEIEHWATHGKFAHPLQETALAITA